MELTKIRFPETIQLGDVTKIDGAKIPPVDIICAGSPCQDLSVAGKREGLKGERSGLFRTAVDIVFGMRNATGGKYPRFFVWENVPGAFNSNKGFDFRAVLEEIGQTEIPMPENNKWANAGLVQCDSCEIAWRLLDAQYFGLAQRRARVFLVADFAESERRAGKILFVEPSRGGDSAESEREGQTVAGSVADSVGDAGEPTDANSICLRDRAGKPGGGKGPLLSVEKSLTLQANTNDQVLFESHPNDSRVTGPVEVAPTVSARYGTGGNNTPLVMGCDTYNGAITGETACTLTSASGAPNTSGPKVMVLNDQGGLTGNTPAVVYGICSKDSNSMKSANPHSGIYEAEKSRTLDTNGANPNCNQGGNVVVYALEGNGSRPSHRGDGWAESETMYTLNTIERHAVAQPMSTTGGQVYTTSKASFMTNWTENQAQTLVATDWKDAPVIVQENKDETDNDG